MASFKVVTYTRCADSHLKGASNTFEGEGVAPGLQTARGDLEVLADVVGVQHHLRAGGVLRHVREGPPLLNDCNGNNMIQLMFNLKHIVNILEIVQHSARLLSKVMDKISSLHGGGQEAQLDPNSHRLSRHH